MQTGTGLANKEVRFSYDAAGLNTNVERYVDGLLKLTTTNAFDAYGRLTGIDRANGSGVFSSDVYDLDILSRLETETVDGQSRSISYDNTDQVKTVTGSNNEGYTYDKNGNRTLAGYVTGSGNRLLSDGVYNYDYDAEGNRTRRTKIVGGEVDLYTWDYRNRLVSIVTTDAGGNVTKTVGYEYDVDDQRVKKTVDGVVENYFIDRDQIAFVTDGSGNETFHYLYGLNVDSVMAQDTPAGMVWSLADRLGSIDLLTDADGNVVDKRTFDSFGRVLDETNPSVQFRYGYTGRERDLESGLDYYRARYYDPRVGRFISTDPIGFEAGDTNLYRYVGNNATNAIDPSGNFTISGPAEDALYAADKFVAGFAHLVTGGYTTQLRNENHGDLVAGQHEGWLFNAGQVAGFGVSALLGFKTPNALFSTPLKAIGAAERVAQAYTVAQAGIGSYNTTTKIIDGKMDWSNPLSYLEVAGSYAPAIGFGAKQIGKIGSVQNALTKATSVAGEIWENASSNLARKTSSAIDRAWESDGFKSFLTKGLNLTNKGLDRIEQSFLWQNQSSQQVLRQKLGSIENLIEKFETNIGNTKITDTLYESLAVNRLNYKSNIKTHLTNYEGYNSNSGFKGGHTIDSFKQGLKENPATFITDIRINPNQPHIYEVKYARPILDPKQRILPNTTRPFPNPKTLYDNRFISDNTIFSYGQIAAAKGYNRFMIGQLPKDRVAGNLYNTLSGGISFSSTIDIKTGQITNHFPTFPASAKLVSTGMTTLP